jgi:dipeptidyl aminopeptidase/acylaminoacyl peptidase
MKPASMIRVVLLAFAAILFAPPAKAEKRLWTSADGQSSFEGELLEFSESEVRIKRAADFKSFALPLERLSETDRAHVAGLLREQARDGGLKKGPHSQLVAGSFVKGVSPEGLNFQFYGDPRWKGSGRYPLVVWLHGAGQSGSDNEAQMGGATRPFTEEANQSKRPCFVLAPQCPDRAIGWKDEVASNLMALIRSLCDSLPIDESRLYLTGSSMGGSGSWRLATEHPGVFAAVVPLCGGGDPARAAALKGTPIWAFHGDKDEDVPLVRSTSMVEAIEAAGGALAKLSVLEGEGHLIASGVYARPELHEWIFEQRLPSASPASAE